MLNLSTYIACTVVSKLTNVFFYYLLSYHHSTTLNLISLQNHTTSFKSARIHPASYQVEVMKNLHNFSTGSAAPVSQSKLKQDRTTIKQ